MSSMVRRTIAIAVVAIALLAGAIWLIASLRDDGGEEDTSGRGAAVMPSDGGGTDPDRAEGTDEDHQEQDEASAASEVSEQPEITGDFTDPEQVASRLRPPTPTTWGTFPTPRSWPPWTAWRSPCCQRSQTGRSSTSTRTTATTPRPTPSPSTAPTRAPRGRSTRSSSPGPLRLKKAAPMPRTPSSSR